MPDSTGAADLSDLPERMKAARRERSAPAGPPGPQGRMQATVASMAMNPDGSGQGSILIQDEHPPWMSARLERQAAELDEFSGHVQERMRQVLHHTGGGIPPESMFSLQMFVLLDMLFPRTNERGQRQFLEYQRRVQERLLSILDQVESQFAQARLAAGAQLPPEILARMAAAQGIPAPAAERRRKGG
jgi:hypothetical protein